MSIVSEFPRPVREIDNLWVTLADGTRLAARAWLPEDAEAEPVPAILEYIPYCKRDGTAARDEAMHPYFAGHGYAAVRVDLRGSGESDGVLLDEYLQRELDDAVEVIAWLAAQPWCTGRVGMMGKSWGGFNALQVAALAPPALACIVTVCSTDDRYADDVHYLGGCLNVANPSWAFSMFLRNPRPPDPALVGERWREMWRERLEANRPWLIDWLSHPLRDEYWKHGSVCEDYAAIRCPVYAIGGWADSYSNAIPRLMAGLEVPRKALIGPWGHQYPHQGYPGPAIGFLQDALRWWDRWLKDVETGIENEPAYRVWMQEYTPPRAFVAERPGRWVAEPQWPSDDITDTSFFAGEGVLSETQQAGVAQTLRSPQSTGAASLNWINSGAADALDEPLDQRIDDGRSLVFDSAPLADDLEILGAPQVVLDVHADKPNALVCARLCELRPDGACARVTYGVLELTHRDSHETPSPMALGDNYRVRIRLNDIAHRFAAGNRIRLALSNAFWPIVWPSPEVVTLKVTARELRLPRRSPREEDDALPEFAPAVSAPLDPRTTLREGAPLRLETIRDHAAGTVVFVRETDSGLVRNDKTGWEHGSIQRRTLSIADHDPLSAKADYEATVEYGREDGPRVTVELTTTMTCDRTHFIVEAAMQAFEDGEPVFDKTWHEKIARGGGAREE